MNCERFQAMAGDLAGEQNRAIGIDTSVGITHANERARALEHAVECDACALIWEEERNLSTGLRNLAVEMRSLTAPPPLEAKVLAAFRERENIGRQSSASVSAFKPRQVQRQPTRYWVAAIAALLLIVFGVVVVRSGILSRSKLQFAGGTPKTNAPSDAPPAENKSTASVSKNDVTSPSAVPNHNDRYLAASHPRRVGRARYGTARVISATLSDPINEGKNEIVTDFFPIGYGTTPNLQEGGQLLRVELPRAAVARFGLPVNMDRPSETVKADVLVGADGLAQAIRFVH